VNRKHSTFLIQRPRTAGCGIQAHFGASLPDEAVPNGYAARPLKRLLGVIA